MHKVGSKGNLVIEAEIRGKLGIVPGSVAIQRVQGHRLIIEFLPPVPSSSAYRSLSRYYQDDPLPQSARALDDLIDDSAAAEATDRDQREWMTEGTRRGEG